jgi:hypothetical protein
MGVDLFYIRPEYGAAVVITFVVRILLLLSTDERYFFLNGTVHVPGVIRSSELVNLGTNEDGNRVFTYCVRVSFFYFGVEHFFIRNINRDFNSAPRVGDAMAVIFPHGMPEKATLNFNWGFVNWIAAAIVVVLLINGRS